MSLESYPFVASGTVEVCRFVKNDTTAGKPFNVVQAGANDPVIGISQEGAMDPPGLSGSANDAARAGHPLKVHGLGSICLLELGTGGATAGDLLESDTDGKGVTADDTAETVRNIGAKALQTGVAGDRIRVQVIIFTQTLPAA